MQDKKGISEKELIIFEKIKFSVFCLGSKIKILYIFELSSIIKLIYGRKRKVAADNFFVIFSDFQGNFIQ